MRFARIEHLAFVRMNSTCADWEDGMMHEIKRNDGEVLWAFKDNNPTVD
jgi:hypothetical protein